MLHGPQLNLLSLKADNISSFLATAANLHVCPYTDGNAVNDTASAKLVRIICSILAIHWQLTVVHISNNSNSACTTHLEQHA